MDPHAHFLSLQPMGNQALSQFAQSSPLHGELSWTENPSGVPLVSEFLLTQNGEGSRVIHSDQMNVVESFFYPASRDTS